MRRAPPSESAKTKDPGKNVPIAKLFATCFPGFGSLVTLDTLPGRGLGVCNPVFQKLEQLNEEQHVLLHDVCCLWVWLVPHLREAFPGTVLEKHKAMFEQGMLTIISVRKPVKF